MSLPEKSSLFTDRNTSHESSSGAFHSHEQSIPLQGGSEEPPSEGFSHSKRRRRRSTQNSSARLPLQQGPWKLQILIIVGVLALLLVSNVLVGRLFFYSGLSEGIQRAKDARTPSKNGEAVAEGIPNKAFAALLNLRDSKPDRPTTEMLTLLSLQVLSDTLDESLPSYFAQGHTTAEDFCAAYIAMRLGDFGKAAAILRATEASIPADLFNYLMNDPVMRRFAREPRVMGFYEES